MDPPGRGSFFWSHAPGRTPLSGGLATPYFFLIASNPMVILEVRPPVIASIPMVYLSGGLVDPPK